MLIPVAVVNENVCGSAQLSPGPPPVAGYVGWYDASDLTTVPVSAGTNLVTSWNDKSGNGFDLSVTTGRPTLVRNLRLDPVVLFDGLVGVSSVTQLATSSISMSDRTFSCFIVGCVTGLERNQSILGPSNDGGNSLVITITTGSLQTFALDSSSLGTQGNAAVVAGVPFVACQILTDSDVTHYLNLTPETDVNATLFSSPRTLRVGAAPSTTSPFNAYLGWMGEIVVYDTSLVSGDAETVISYLMSKWGIS